MTYSQIKNILEDIDKKEYSHVLICVDTWDYEYYVKTVSRDEDIDKYIQKFYEEHSGGMHKIEEVYNLDLDIEDQLKEIQPYHIEKAKRKIIIEFPEVMTRSEEALEYATEKHKGQFRKGSTHKPYITHPINVANLLMKYKKSHMADELKAACYLHDTIEDTDVTYEDLAKKFGIQVASLVREVTSTKELKEEVGKEKYLSYKMKNMSSWALDIKLCDILDNISDLASVNDEFRKKTINQKINIISYVVKNRKLTNTHLAIIKDIIIVSGIIVNNTYSEKEQKEFCEKMKKMNLELK